MIQVDKPTVVVATGTMNAGGTETLLMETFRQATGRVKYIILIHYDQYIPKGIFDNELARLNVNVQYIPSVGSVGVRGYVKAFKQLIDKIGHVDIIHSHLNGVGGIIAMAAKKAGIKNRICHCHADIHFRGSLMAKLRNELALCSMKLLIDRYATERWACSTAAWKRLFMPWRRRRVMHNMIDTQKYIATEEKRKQAKAKFGLRNQFIVGSVGRVAPIKNYECMLRALVGTDAHFVCFGRFDIQDPYCRSLANLAQALGVSERVHWMGNSNEISNDIHCIDLFVMPSFTEGFGMAAIEAQAASIPSLLSEGVPSAVDVGIGLIQFLNPHAPTLWHNAISHVRRTPLLSKDVIIKAFEEAGFDAPASVKQLEDTYLALINK